MSESLLWILIGICLLIVALVVLFLRVRQTRSIARGTLVFVTMLLVLFSVITIHPITAQAEEATKDTAVEPARTVMASSTSAGTTSILLDRQYPVASKGKTYDKFIVGLIAAGNDFTIVLSLDGKVTCIGNRKKIGVDNWENIRQVSAHADHALGLRQDKTVVFAGVSLDGEDNVQNWKSIIQVVCCNKGSIGLTDKGRVRYAGFDGNDIGDCTKWTGIKQVFEGEDHFIALGKSGMLVGSGSHGGGDGRRKIAELTDVVYACAANGSTIAVFSNGTVRALGTDYAGEDKVGSWRDIVAVAGGDEHTVGLKRDGTVVAAGDNTYGQCDVSGWTNIIEICCGQYHTVGVRNDGTLVATGLNTSGQCDVGAIDLW
jgi:alpha-tubulin suppressor-like RCC1 family protein